MWQTSWRTAVDGSALYVGGATCRDVDLGVYALSPNADLDTTPAIFRGQPRACSGAALTCADDAVHDELAATAAGSCEVRSRVGTRKRHTRTCAAVMIPGYGAWTGPRSTDCAPGTDVLVAPVSGDRWPYGPPPHHQPGCWLHTCGLFCDCAASCADDSEWGIGL